MIKDDIMIWLIGNKGMLGSDIEICLQREKFNYIVSDKEVDVTDVGVLKRFIDHQKIDWIINCAAYTAVDKAEDDKELAFKINADGVLNIAEVAKELEAKLIHISTDYVFDGKTERDYLESDPTNPMSVYGLSKLAGEKNILETHKKYFILRTAWLYGKNGNNFPYTMLRLFKEKGLAKVVNDQFGSPTYAKDLAECVMEIIRNNSEKYSIYHFTNEGKTNWYEFACEIYHQAEKRGLLKNTAQIIPIKTEEYPAKAKRPKNSFLSKDKIKKDLNIHIRHWREGLAGFIDEIAEG